MSLLSVEIPAETLARVARIAASENATIDRIVNDALDRLIEGEEQMDYLKRRAARGRASGVTLKSLFDKTKSGPPLPGDELPE